MRIKVWSAVAAMMTAAMLALAGSPAMAQAISQTAGDSSAAAAGLGQSFTATVTGVVTQIQVRPRFTGAATVYFFNGPGSGAASSNATAVSSQVVNLVDTGSNAAGLQTIVLNTPLPVTAGQQYSFAFNTGTYALTFTNPYAGGTLIVFYNTPSLSDDLAFTVTQVVPVPTLAEWAMILLGLTLAGGAAVIIQRRYAAI